MTSTPEFKYILEILNDDLELPAKRFYLSEGEHILGSLASSDIPLPLDTISRRHARLQVLGEKGLLIEDLNSTNGTFVARKRIRQSLLTEPVLLGFGSIEANLIPVSREAQIAIPCGAEVEPVSLSAPVNKDATTIQIDSNRQLIDSLRKLSVALMAGEIHPGEFTSRLTEEWGRITDATAMEIRKKSLDHADIVVDSWGQVPPDQKATLSIHHPSGTSLSFWFRHPVSRPDLHPLSLFVLDMLTIGRKRKTPDHEIDQTLKLPGAGTRNTAVRQIYTTCRKIARGSIPVLILGESGTGKEVLARWIHEQSARKGDFLTLNCATLGRDLLEAELFGVEKGAATGVQARPGILERANGGSIFLDEIGEMPQDMQARLLRALEDTEVYRVGGKQPIAIDVRFIAATNQALEQQVLDERFRLDLFHRLAAFDVTLPPLHQRREDIPVLARFFFEKAARQIGISSPGITESALAALLHYTWPGNIRELKNEIERAILLLDPGEPLDECHLSERCRPEKKNPPNLTLEQAVSNAETEAFRIALALSNNDANRAMRILGLSKTSYYRKLKQYAPIWSDDDAE